MSLIVWQHFTISLKDNSILECSIFKTTIKKKLILSLYYLFLIKHLKTQHSESYKKSQRELLVKIEVVLYPYLRRK